MTGQPQPQAAQGPLRALVRWFAVRLLRRMLVVVAMLLALAVLLFGDGLGWFPGRGTQGQDPIVHDDPPATPDAPPAEPGPGGSAVQADQRSVLWSLVREAASLGALADGFDAVRRLRAMPTSPAEREALARAEATLELALVRELAQLRELLRNGHVHAARAALAALLHGTDSDVVRIVREDCMRNGMPDLTATGEPSWPAVEPAPLARGRIVVLVREGSSSRTLVADARPGFVTVRLQRPEGVSWPLVPVTQVELPDPTAAEALAMAHAARGAGDAPLARLWLGCCLQLPGGEELAGGLRER